ncbi:MAG TPA: hypothetical protein VFB62_00605 [Polyangiaceae bacterium]|nr:hypothetical protein [Polyangiaceae bacterium]
MARSSELALRVPSEARGGGPIRREPGEDRPQLRLVVTRGQLGIELAQRFAMAPLSVEDMALSLPEVRFPVELSSGAAGFRHKRGRLERLALSLTVGDAQRFCELRWKKLLDGEIVHRLTAPLEDGWLAGMATDASALAFEVLLAPRDGDLRLVPTAARGLGLSAPPQALALLALAALFKPHAHLVGGAVVVEHAPALLVRELLPLAGVRAPEARGLAWSDTQFEVTQVKLVADRERAPFTPGARALRALELAALVAEAEEALVSGDLDRARRGYLDALTRAPRHPELARRLAEVDRAVGDRAEAALATISDVMPPADAGPLGGVLLAAVGDRAGARHAFVRAAEQEPYGALAALCWLEASGDEGALLDEAVARAPTLAAPRWRRYERHVRAGNLVAARGDIEHLEAAARTASDRHDVARRAASFLAGERAYEEASSMYERALRYAPDSAHTVAGLARSLEALGHGRRALELMGRAVMLAERKGQPLHGLRLAYATLVAEQADDRPLAIAQVRAIPPHALETFDARLLEARWRAELGDLSGASEALARLADAVEAAVAALVDGGEDARTAVAQLLLEGARIHEIDRRDFAAARRLLALGMRLAPRRGPIQRAYERLATVSQALAPSSDAVTVPKPRVESSPHSITLDVDVGTVQAVRDELRAEELTTALRANPGNEGVALALSDVLERLGRDHELLALLSARVEETDGELRAQWLARRRTVLQRLVEAAIAAGRHDEANLYRSLLEADA